MLSKYRLLVPIDLTANFLVNQNWPMISMLVDAGTGGIVACVCSAGNAVDTTRLRALLNAFELSGHSYCTPSRGIFFKTCNIIKGVSGRALTDFDEWKTLHVRGARSTIKYLKPEWAEMFLYYLYDWPLNCYPADGSRDMNYKTFRNLILITVERYSNWLNQNKHF